MFQWMDLLQEVRRLQEQLDNEVRNTHVEVETADGRIRIEMDGTKRVKYLRIDPSLLHPEQRVELEQWLLTALEEAVAKVEAAVQAKMRQLLPGDWKLPGF